MKIKEILIQIGQFLALSLPNMDQCIYTIYTWRLDLKNHMNIINLKRLNA